MEYLEIKSSAEKNEKLDSLSISIEEEAQDLELSGFTTTGSFSSVASWIGTCASSGSSLSSAGD